MGRTTNEDLTAGTRDVAAATMDGFYNSDVEVGGSVNTTVNRPRKCEGEKEKRAEKVLYVKYLDMEMRWIAGSANDFADLLSRLVEQIGKAARERERETRSQGHTGANVTQRTTEGGGHPECIT